MWGRRRRLLSALDLIFKETVEFDFISEAQFPETSGGRLGSAASYKNKYKIRR